MHCYIEIIRHARFCVLIITGNSVRNIIAGVLKQIENLARAGYLELLILNVHTNSNGELSNRCNPINAQQNRKIIIILILL